jgi:hypothetical protein
VSEQDRDRLADWLLSTRGRLVRVVAGTILILIGLGILRGGILGILLLILGAIPIASAAYGTLLIGPLLGRDTRGRRPEEQPKEEEPRSDEDDEDEDSAADDEPDDDDAPKADPNWEAPPLARAERAEGEGPRTRDLRAED